MDLGNKVDKILDTQIKILQRLSVLETKEEEAGKRYGIIYGGGVSLVIFLIGNYLLYSYMVKAVKP